MEEVLKVVGRQCFPRGTAERSRLETCSYSPVKERKVGDESSGRITRRSCNSCLSSHNQGSVKADEIAGWTV